MAEVATLRIAEHSVNKDVRKFVDDLRERVLAGEVLAIAFVEVGRAGDVTTAYVVGGQYHRLNSGCARLAVKVASAADDD